MCRRSCVLSLLQEGVEGLAFGRNGEAYRLSGSRGRAADVWGRDVEACVFWSGVWSVGYSFARGDCSSC